MNRRSLSAPCDRPLVTGLAILMAGGLLLGAPALPVLASEEGGGGTDMPPPPRISPTSQTRTTSFSCYAEDLSGFQSDSGSDSAPGFLPWISAVGNSVTVFDALGDGGASQRSEIRDNSLGASGSFFGTAESYSFDGFADGDGRSDFTVTFDLLVDSAYRLAGQLEAFDNGSAEVRLTDGSGGLIFDEFAFGPSAQVPVNNTGMLTAGTYTLTVFGDGFASAGGGGFDYGSGSFDISFVAGASGAGGEVPDGKDVPGGPPLMLTKTFGTNARLDWGVSCRPDDTDFAVYEGSLGAPTTSLSALTCSTGGARQYSVGGVSSVFYLVVPNDGATEGSYGDDSNMVERLPSAAACFPQSLGAPVCP